MTMLELRDVWKSAQRPGEKESWLLNGASVSLPQGGRIALLGSDRAQNAAVLRMLSGLEDPDKGTLRRDGVPCWPFDYGGFTDNQATVSQNANFLARVYGVDAGDVARIAGELSGVRLVRGKPLKHYAGPDRKAIALGLTLAFQFDWYFVDDRLPASPAGSEAAVEAAIADRMAHATVIWATTRPELLAGYCDAGLVLDQGTLTFYTDVTDALEAFNQSTEPKVRRRHERKSRDPDRRRGPARSAGPVDTEEPR